MTVPAWPGVDPGSSPIGAEAAFDAELRTQLARARVFIPLAHLAELDTVLAHARGGHHGWAMLWSSLSLAQGRLMSSLGRGAAHVPVHVCSHSITFWMAADSRVDVGRACGVASGKGRGVDVRADI